MNPLVLVLVLRCVFGAGPHELHGVLNELGVHASDECVLELFDSIDQDGAWHNEQHALRLSIPFAPFRPAASGIFASS